MKLIDEFIFDKKSKIKASEGLQTGAYKFFTSSNNCKLYLNNYLYEGECVILGTGGMPSCNWINGRFACSTDNFVLKAKKDYSTKFLYYFLKYDNFRILSEGFHGAGLKHISKNYVENIELLNLTKETQLNIVREFDLISKNIEVLHNKINILDELIKSRFNGMKKEGANICQI